MQALGVCPKEGLCGVQVLLDWANHHDDGVFAACADCQLHSHHECHLKTEMCNEPQLEWHKYIAACSRVCNLLQQQVARSLKSVSVLQGRCARCANWMELYAMM